MLLGFPAEHAVWSDGFVESSANPEPNASYVFGYVESYLEDGTLIWRSCEAVKTVHVLPFQRYLVDIQKPDQLRRIGVEACFLAQAYKVCCPISFGHSCIMLVQASSTDARELCGAAASGGWGEGRVRVDGQRAEEELRQRTSGS
eukprot:1445487-Rhodomonas_salina.1